MIARVWKSEFDRQRKEDLVAFATNISLPMLQTRPGNCGVFFFSHDGVWITLTLWTSEDAITRLDRDPDYQQVAEAIVAHGVLQGTPSTEVHQFEGGALTKSRKQARSI